MLRYDGAASLPRAACCSEQNSGAGRGRVSVTQSTHSRQLCVTHRRDGGSEACVPPPPVSLCVSPSEVTGGFTTFADRQGWGQRKKRRLGGSVRKAHPAHLQQLQKSKPQGWTLLGFNPGSTPPMDILSRDKQRIIRNDRAVLNIKRDELVGAWPCAVQGHDSLGTCGITGSLRAGPSPATGVTPASLPLLHLRSRILTSFLASHGLGILDSALPSPGRSPGLALGLP